MLEYNADTPTLLVESMYGQRSWLQDVSGGGNTGASGAALLGVSQFNRLEADLVKGWRELLARAVSSQQDNERGLTPTQHFACVREHEEDLQNTKAMRECARIAGVHCTEFFALKQSNAWT
jgi:glutathionylspermidine synthase